MSDSSRRRIGVLIVDDHDMVRVGLRTLLSADRGIELQGVEVIHSVRSLLSAIHGFVMLGRGGAFGMPVGIDDSFNWLIGHLWDSLARQSETDHDYE